MRDDIRKPDESASENEQDIRRIDMDELLLRMLAPPLRRDARLATLDDHEKSLLKPDESASENEQDIRRIDMDELLLRMLAPPLRRDARLATLDDHEKSLLNALAGNIARDGKVFSLARDPVDLVDVDDADLRTRNIEISGGDELQKDVLDILTDITRLGKRRGVGDGERNLKRARKRLSEQGLARTRGAEQHDVASRRYRRCRSPHAQHRNPRR